MNGTKEQTFFEESTRFVVNSQYFSPRDYALFVESIEIISRIERQRKERLGKRKERKERKSSSNTKDNCSNPDETPNTSDVELEHELKLDVDDENYFSGSATNSPPTSLHFDNKHNVIGSEIQPISDSEDSGVYPVAPTYENIQPRMRPRANVILQRNNSVKSNNRTSTLRSRLIKLVRKHSVIQKRKEGDKCAEMHNMKSKKFKTLSLRKKFKGIKTDAEKAQTADMHFLNKALNYLTF